MSAAAAKAKMQSAEAMNRAASRSLEHAGSKTISGTDANEDEDGDHSYTNINPTTSEPLCEGDTTIISNLLPPSLAASAFEQLKAEVAWERMSHQGGEVPRLVAVQGEVDDEGNRPAYRHPADESPPLLPFSPTVLKIKGEVEKQVGHPLNHVLIQFYRDGNDYISEHSDKTLDIVRGSFIANVSLGAERTMVFRTKRLDKDPSRKHGNITASPKPEGDTAGGTHENSSETPAEESSKRRIERARLPHNSLCRMGLATNMRWLHAIRQDKRLDREKTSAETAYSGARISLTFRRIGTFLDATQSCIWGQGAVSKARAEARPVINGQTAEAVRLLQAFGTENHSSDFDWDRYYGSGFDVLHINSAPRLFSSADAVVNMRVAMMLADLGVSYAKGSTGGAAAEVGSGNDNDNNASIKFVDNDPAKSTVEGQLAIMLYLDAVYGGSKRNEPPVSQPELARRYTRLQAALGLLDIWRAFLKALAARGPSNEGSAPPSSWDALMALRRELAVWDEYAREAAAASAPPGYIAGGERASVADFALWPVLHDMMITQVGVLHHCQHLMEYYSRLKKGKAGAKVLGGGGQVKDESEVSSTQ
jgi:alkylated DNA repair dioxygenase AlkB/glutathione S-transferase